jgi:hypothetical protein
MRSYILPLAYTHMYDTHTYVLQPDTHAFYHLLACNWFLSIWGAYPYIEALGRRYSDRVLQ